MKKFLVTAIDIVFGVKYLGHGLGTDVFLFLATTLYAIIILIVPNEMLANGALWDLAWNGWGRWLAVPFIIKSILTGTGVVTTIAKKSCGRYFRFNGGLVGITIWYWFIVKYIFVGEILALGFSFSIVAALFSLRILAISWANLPRQGIPL